MAVVRAAALTVAVALVVALAGCGGDDAGPAGNQAPGEGRIERVVDGDTIVVELSSGSEKVRLIGIDTPESVDPRQPVECFGKEASAHTAELLPVGAQVRLVRDAEPRDRYGRLLAYVYRLPDELFVNLSLVIDGYAVPLTYPPNVAHTDEIVAAAGEAREAGRGLWSACGGADTPA
jgi:micrococcal nuclease